MGWQALSHSQGDGHRPGGGGGQGRTLGQTSGQRLLARLVQVIPQAVATALAAAEPVAFAPLLGVHGARHETQYSRLFRS